MTSRTRRIDHHGVEIAVTIDGDSDAPPVLLLHGITGCSATYDFLLDELPRHRLIRMDLRGHGRSGRAPGHYLIGEFSSDVPAVIEELADRPVVIVAHSFGGMIAVQIAQDRPDLVGALFLEDAGLYANDPDWMEASGFGPGFAALPDALDEWRATRCSSHEIATMLGSRPLPDGTTVADHEEHDSLEASGCGLVELDPAVLHPVLAGTIVADFDADRPIRAPGVLLKPDDASGPAFLERDVARLEASNAHIQLIRTGSSGHLIHGSKTHRPIYLDHLREFLGRYAPVGPT